jgi:hypothetical protein
VTKIFAILEKIVDEIYEDNQFGLFYFQYPIKLALNLLMLYEENVF